MKNNNAYSIVGGSIWGNRGAEAMLATTVGEIRQFNPEASFHVYSIYPKKDKTLINDPKINIRDGRPLAFGLLYFPLALIYYLLNKININLPLPKSLKKLKDSQYLLDIGGITFSDGRSLQLLYNTFSIWPAMLLGIPVVKLSQAMGPFQTKLNQALAKYFLPKCEKIFARGDITYHHLKSLSLAKERIDQSADIAFLYKPEYSLSRENEEKVERQIKKLEKIKANKTKIASLIPSSLVLKRTETDGTSYSEKLLKIIEALTLDEIFVIVLPNATRFATGKSMNNDLIAINLLKNQSANIFTDEIMNKILWIDYDINTKSVRSFVKKSDALITSRFHGMIAGLSNCIPTLVIGWSHKYQETLSDFKVEKYAINYKSSVQNTLDLFIEFWGNNNTIRESLLNNESEVIDSTLRQFNYLQKTYLYPENE